MPRAQTGVGGDQPGDRVASMAAYTPVPRMAVYGAAKAFVLSFTEALWYEHRTSGPRVLALSPSATQTEFFDTAGQQAAGGRRLQTPQQVVATALRTLDRRNPPHRAPRSAR
ncbi:MAG TPA: SDR family NAD(P)-dependent oxidoreductase [Pseudonocardiaceae bacterium]